MFKELNINQIQYYTQLWANAENAHLFQDYNWLQTVITEGQELKLFGLFKESKLIAAFPMLKIKSRIFKIYSLPFLTPYLGFFYEEKTVDKNEIKTAFDKTLISIRKDNMFYSVPPWQNIDINKAHYQTRLTHTIDLSSDIEVIFNNFKSDKKRNIKNAIREGLNVSFEHNPKTLKNLIEKTYNRQDKSVAWIHSGMKLVTNYKNSFQVTVLDNNTPLSSLFIAYDKNRAYYMFGGYDDSFKNYNAGPYAMYEAIKTAKSLGLKIFDFEGSEIEPIKKYFQRFGPIEEFYQSIEMSSLKYKIYRKLL